MKKSIPFEFFAPNQFMYFDLKRLGDMERELNMSIVDIVRQPELGTVGMGFIVAACRHGLAHHYSARPGVIERIIESSMESPILLFNQDLIMAIYRALLASGILGKEIADKAISGDFGKTEEETQADEKNAEVPVGG